jgi:hypothetical protein
MPSLFFSVVARLSVSTAVLVRLPDGSFAFFLRWLVLFGKSKCATKSGGTLTS